MSSLARRARDLFKMIPFPEWITEYTDRTPANPSVALSILNRPAVVNFPAAGDL